MKIAWTQFGPARATSIAVPPTPSLIDWYVVGHDEAAKQVFYACKPDGKRELELHAFDGKTWILRTKKPIPFEGNPQGGGWDSRRKGIVVWSFEQDYEVERARAGGTLLTAAGAKPLKTTGDEPIAEPDEDEEIGTFDKTALFAFDRKREVWVCLTRRGVWELDANGAWAKKSGGQLVPAEWHGKTGEGTYDPIGKRTVFWMQEGDKYKLVLLAWDGAKLTRLPMTGLPALTIGFSDLAACVCGHARHGLVLLVGAKLFKLGAKGWTALPAASDPPPNMEAALLVHDPGRDLLVLGPGKHEGAGGSDRNDVFFVLRGKAWEKQGVQVVYSPVKDASYGNCRMGHAGGAWYALGTHSLRTWKWVDDAWKEIVDKNAGKLGGWEPLELVTASDKLHAVLASGAVFVLEKDRWRQVCKNDAAFKGRTDFAVASDPSGRIVVWGGEAKGRKLNDTLFLDAKGWRVAKKPSPQPADFKHGKDWVFVGTTMIFDPALGRMVRFGFEQVAVLQDDETWKLSAPKGYKSLVSERKWGHVPVHEAGETLLVDFQGARVVRFDLGGCAELATFEYPPETAPKKHGDAAALHALCQSFSWDASTRSLHAQVLVSAADTFRLDLGPLFAQAKKLGPRAVPKQTASQVAPARFYNIAGGKVDVATNARAGYVPAAELGRDALAALAGVESRAIKLGKKGVAASRLGGAPSGITAKAWPRVRKEPMGFLFQLETGKLLKKHAGVAVFCSLDGEATTEDDENTVLLLKAGDLAKASAAAPDGVPTLPARPLELGPPLLELDEARALALGGADAGLAAAFEKLAAGKGMQRENLCDKLGGVPQFLQGEANLKNHIFVAQLDFDGISTPAWPSAGLAGCIYVFVKSDESSAVAFWQYT